MTKIIKENQDFICYTTDPAEAMQINNNLLDQKYKVDLLEGFTQEGQTTITYYLNTIPLTAKDKLLAGADPDYITVYDRINDFFHSKTSLVDGRYIVFCDMCEWPHVQTTKEIPADCFALQKIAGAYWRGNENNAMMTRIYGLAFEDKKALKEYLELLEEAKKRDHRTLGKQLQLFAFDDEVGAWLPLWLPAGSILVEELERLAKETEQQYGYDRVRSPHITKEDLYIKSWHLPYYADGMFPPMELDNEKYYLKPMNCPHHHKIYAATPKSYRDLPVRFAEYGHCYRYEDSGSLFGLMRVRSLCMNDAHIYCSEEQFEEEFRKVIEMYLTYFKLFGIVKFQMRLSKHSKEGLGKKYVDNEKLWIHTEDLVRKVLIKCEVPFVEADNEAAFYGPKIDVQIWSIIGREFTLATNQLDFAVPERFSLTYKASDGSDQTPLCIHRAPLGTHERFIGFLIEHFWGAFPIRLAPTQAMIIPVADAFVSRCQELTDEMKTHWLRVKIDDSNDSFAKKIRNAELMKIPYIVIIGEKEVADQTVSLRIFKTKEQLTMSASSFVAQVIQQYQTRSL